MILTCLYDAQHQRLTMPQHVTLKGHAPMSESESKVFEVGFDVNMVQNEGKHM